MLAMIVQKHLKIKSTSAVPEAAGISRFNEKTIRDYIKEFFPNKDTF